MNLNYHPKRQELLHQMAQLDTMEYGSLHCEYRPSQSDRSAPPLGPYFKHQVWHQGRNRSRRVPAEQAPALATAIANRQAFEKLAGDFVALTVAYTRRADAKKNSPA